MDPNQPRPAFAAIAIAATTLAGCQTYEPKPLDPEAHAAAWRERSPSDETVIEFAARLAERSDPLGAAFDPADGVTMAEAELIALVFNPDLRVARLRAGVAAASAEHAGLWDDPAIGVDVLRIIDSVPNPWVIGSAISITIPISGRLEVEKDRADAVLLAQLERVAESEWRVRHELRLAWLEWSALRLLLEEHQRLVGSLKSLVVSTDRLAEAGELRRTEAALFSIERTRRTHELLRLRGRAAEAEQRLRAIMGLSPQAPLRPVPILALDAPDPSRDPLATNPSLARERREYEVAEQTLRREIRKQYPDLTLGPNYEFDQGQSRIGLIGAIPIPLLNANRQAIAEARAERELARAMYETTYERLAGETAAARARADSLDNELAVVLGTLAPMVDRQLADAERLLALGEAEALVLLESISHAHETKAHLIETRRDLAGAHATLDFIAGPEPIAAFAEPTP